MMIAVCCFFCTLFQRALQKIISVINESNNLDIALIVASPPPIIAPLVGPVRCGAGICPDPSRIVVASSILAVIRLALPSYAVAPTRTDITLILVEFAILFHSREWGMLP
jgi:hypothetical protein